MPEEAYPALAARYGHAAHDVLALAAERGELAQPIVAGLPDLLAEVALAARHEQARSIGDVLLRRTRLGLLAARELSAERRTRAGRARRRRARRRARLGRGAHAAGDRALRRGGPRRGAAVAVSARGAAHAGAPRRLLRAAGRELELGARPLLMGIVNASPDSFSDGGRRPTLDAQAAAGARSCSPPARTSLDVGGESATTGRPPVAAEQRRSSASCR